MMKRHSPLLTRQAVPHSILGREAFTFRADNYYDVIPEDETNPNRAVAEIREIIYGGHIVLFSKETRVGRQRHLK